MAEVDGIPIDDDCGQEVEPGDPVVLAFGGAITDLTLATDAERILERMVGFTLVEPDLGAPLHIGVENPFYEKECALDAADLAQRHRQIVLARV